MVDLWMFMSITLLKKIEGGASLLRDTVRYFEAACQAIQSTLVQDCAWPFSIVIASCHWVECSMMMKR